MASFPTDEMTWGRVDWRILRLGAVSRYRHLELLNEHVTWLEAHDYRVYVFDAATWTSKAEALLSIGRAFGFEAGPGPNLDAFNDDFGDIEVPDDGGVVLVFRHFDEFYFADPETAWHLLDIIEHNSRRFLLFGRRLLALVHTEDHRIQFQPVGARHVHWNSTEGTRFLRESFLRE